MTNNKTNNENLEKRIEDILGDVKEGGLTKDSIAMIICLEDDIKKLKCHISIDESTIRLIKEKKVFAAYKGDRNIPFDVDQFTLCRNSEE